MRFVLALLALSFFAASAQAQEGYPSTCDPLDPTFGCIQAAMRYDGPDTRFPAFPHDIERADALWRMFFDTASDLCIQADTQWCQMLASRTSDISDAEINATYSFANRSRAAALALDMQCADGDARACVLLADTLRAQQKDGSTLGETLEIEKGASPSQAKDIFAAKFQKYVERNETLSKAQHQKLRAACASTDQTACNELGTFLAWNARFRTSEFEHLPFVHQNCAAGSRQDCGFFMNALTDLTMFSVDEADRKIADEWSQIVGAGCEAQNALMCDVYAILANDPEELKRIQQLGCDVGSAMLCTHLAESFLRSYEQTKDDVEALQKATDLLTRACDLNAHYACHVLEHLSKG